MLRRRIQSPIEHPNGNSDGAYLNKVILLRTIIECEKDKKEYKRLAVKTKEEETFNKHPDWG
jgi:hypothetical protein